MKVSDLAKEFNTTNKFVLDKLKALRLKAKDGSQELNNAVVIVLRSELGKELKQGTVPIKKEIPLVHEKVKDAQKDRQTDSTKKAIKVKDDVTKEKNFPVKKKVTKVVEEESEKIPPPKPGRKKIAVEEKQEKPNKIVSVEPVISAKKSEKEKKADETESVAAKAQQKVKSKISIEPFVPLKPLTKKKRKITSRTRDSRADEFEEDVTAFPESSGSSAFAEQKQSTDSAKSAAEISAEQEEDLRHLTSLEIKVPISVKDFAVRIDQKTGVVLKKLMQMGIFTNINQNLGEDVIRSLAREFGFNLIKVKTQEQQLIETHRHEEEDAQLLSTRAPVVTFMGHVDHGKTSLLDRLRKTRLVDAEHGGITQHIGAYSVAVPKGKITFLDTPGHEAFTAMRARGAHITDLVVLVIAADEGIMPQTEEAIDHARAAGVPIVVALNKIDRKTADPDRVKKQLMAKDLTPEDWGGKTICVGVSALTGQGIDELLEMILLEAELLELKANTQKNASGIVVEAHLSHGKGSMASLIVQSGTLHVNDIIVVGPHYGKVKALFDDLEKPIKEAGPSTPVEILGLSGVPEAGEMFYVVNDERQAKEIVELRQEQLKDKRLSENKRITLEDLYSRIKEGLIKELNVILKADVQGSLEALKDSLEKIPSNEVKVKFIHTGVGDINASDVILATASTAIIIGFHVSVGPRATQELEKNPVDVRQYRIIYDAVNDVRKALEGMLDPKTKRKSLGRVEVRQIFKLSKSGLIAGCYVSKGKVLRKANVEVLRNGEVVHTGHISSLKRFKDDVKDVQEGFECGISIDGFDTIQTGDILDVYEVEKIARTL